ncbi:MAG: PilN domain-containing protein [Candidatus Omnitrophica bacterium]|nr:PilN domain-containing protein [Candidatus Omnitrophota bacterium]
MKRINLIPPEFATGRKALVGTDLQRKAVALVAVFLVVFLIQFLLGWVEVVKLEREVKVLNQKVVKDRSASESFQKSKEAVSAQLESVQKVTAQLLKKQELLSQLKNERLKWSEALSEFYETLPKKVWVDELHLERGKSYVRGGTFGNEFVGEFMNSLNEAPHFANATFTRTEAGKLNNQPVVNYELGFQLIPKQSS